MDFFPPFFFPTVRTSPVSTCPRYADDTHTHCVTRVFVVPSSLPSSSSYSSSPSSFSLSRSPLTFSSRQEDDGSSDEQHHKNPPKALRIIEQTTKVRLRRRAESAAGDKNPFCMFFFFCSSKRGVSYIHTRTHWRLNGDSWHAKIY